VEYKAQRLKSLLRALTTKCIVSHRITEVDTKAIWEDATAFGQKVGN